MIKKPKGILKKKDHKSSKKHKHRVSIQKEEDNINTVNQKLPENIFENIIDMEIELSEEFSYDKFLCLFQLYSKIIQYYSLNDPSKVRIYQNRMEQYLTKKDTLHILTKFNKDHKIGTQLHIYYNQETGLPMVQPKIRGKLKTIYKLKAKEIKIDEIREKVKSILKDGRCCINEI